LLLIYALAASLAGGVLPLRDQWRSACAVLAAGDGHEASRLFAEFRNWYGEEEEVSAPEFRERLLRYHALACLAASDSSAAIPILEEWFREYPDAPAHRAFLRYQLATAYGAVGKTGKMKKSLEKFLHEHADLPEAILVHWHLADIAIAGDNHAEAAGQFRRILAHDKLSPAAAGVARCAFATLQLREESAGETLRLLQGEPHGPFLAKWRAVLAPGLAARLLGKGEAGKAWAVSGWFRPAAATAEELRRLLPTTQPGDALSFRAGLWRRHWRKQLESLCGGIGEGKTAIPSLDQLYGLRLRALSAAGHAFEATVLGEALVDAPHISTELRTLAFATVVRGHQALEEWEAAEGYALRFLEAFPDHPALPRILFLNARTAVLQSRYTVATKQLGSLIAAYPQHDDLPRWELELASCRLQAGEAATALRILAALRERAPASWRALLRFKEGCCLVRMGRSEEAGEALRSVPQESGATTALRESTLVERLKLARGGAGRFLSLLDDYKRHFPDGRHAGLVGNLAGGFHLARREFDKAEPFFLAAVERGGTAADFAREKLVTVYQNSGDKEALQAHLLSWLRRAAEGEPVPEKPFVRLRQLVANGDGIPIPAELIRTLHRNLMANTVSFPVPAFLALLEETWTNAARHFAASTSFPDWLKAEIRRANGVPALLLSLYRAERLQRAGRSDSADAIRLRLLEQEITDPLPAPAAFALAQVSAVYDFPGARSRLESFLAAHPHSPDIPESLFLLAGVHLSAGKTEPARPLLRTVHNKFPDAAIWPEAGETYASVLMSNGEAEEAVAVAGGLLASPDLSPLRAASLLLLKAEADAARGRFRKVALDCQRLLVLYPSFSRIREKAGRLLRDAAEKLAPEKAAAVRRFLRETRSLAAEAT
jgi:TolA-binding protein